jgi:indolepyruvate ferredoxin oxidoreductase beta subunit
MELNFLIVGVGGQGTLLASNVLALVGVEAGYDVKKAEVHGMSQRGGSVNSHIRWGKGVKSPVIGKGEVDILISLEKLETLRYLDMLRNDGFVLIGDFKIPPLSASSGDDRYPDDDTICQVVGQFTEKFEFIPTLTLAESAGTTRAHNIVLLGALSTKIKQVPTEIWLRVIESQVPFKYIDLNREAFQLGREFALEKV